MKAAQMLLLLDTGGRDGAFQYALLVHNETYVDPWKSRESCATRKSAFSPLQTRAKGRRAHQR